MASTIDDVLNKKSHQNQFIIDLVIMRQSNGRIENLLKLVENKK